MSQVFLSKLNRAAESQYGPLGTTSTGYCFWTIYSCFGKFKYISVGFSSAGPEDGQGPLEFIYSPNVHPPISASLKLSQIKINLTVKKCIQLQYYFYSF